MADFVLFATEACHLCEEAERLLQAAELKFDVRDIITDEQAQADYAVRIPVLLHKPSGLDLGWPFDRQALQDFLAKARG